MRYLIIAVVVLAGYFGWQTYDDRKTEQAEKQVEKIEEESVAEVPNKQAGATETVKPVAAVPTSEPTTAAVFVDNSSVPFTTQAPTGEWSDQRQQDGCEEASALMAIRWVQGKKSISSSEARKEIIAMSDFSLKKYGEYRDVSLEDLKKWIFEDYFKYSKVEVKKNVTIKDMINELQKGKIIIIPANGQKLGNPYFSPPGPERHMLVVRGYDPKKKQFITNDPGTKRGNAYRYNEQTLYNSIMAYPTGYHIPVNKIEKNILLVSK